MENKLFVSPKFFDGEESCLTEEGKKKKAEVLNALNGLSSQEAKRLLNIVIQQIDNISIITNK